jgi:hypothetical protein
MTRVQGMLRAVIAGIVRALRPDRGVYASINLAPGRETLLPPGYQRGCRIIAGLRGRGLRRVLF